MFDSAALQTVFDSLNQLRDAALGLEREFAVELGQVHPRHRRGAANLVHYLALRRQDLRPLQAQLVRLGLSSLGRCEPHVLATLDAVRGWIATALGVPQETLPSAHGALSMTDATVSAAEHAEALLGPKQPGRDVRVLVTMAAEMAADPAAIGRLTSSGMDLARINCAHDGPATWAALCARLAVATPSGAPRCRILMDLAGPKLRTGHFAPGPCVVKWRPERDELGRETKPAVVALVAEAVRDVTTPSADAVLPVTDEFVAAVQPGAVLVLHDARGRQRQLVCTARGDGYALCSCERTAYVTPGCSLVLLDGSRGGELLTGEVGELPARPGEVELAVDDRLDLCADAVPGRMLDPDVARAHGVVAEVSCTLPEVFGFVRVGERVFFDDGRIGGVIEATTPTRMRVCITHTAGSVAHLRADKGINFPDTRFELPGLTIQDRRDLKFVVAHADAVALSFLDQPEDVDDLQRALAEAGRADMPIVLKIETKQGFNRLARVLLTALRSPVVGVMIARGDLAVECGFERMAEVQEEILWLCEAAHVPAIWATQVLDSLARTGMPTRAEITDAAMAERAECVMLNKGPYAAEAVRMLRGILQRMNEHQSKKRALMRELHVAQG
jgi:pyruvate kinase